MNTENTVAVEKTEKIQITISGVLALIDDYKTRDEIAAHYGITKAECSRLFKHPKLAGIKTKKRVIDNFVVVDDVIPAGEAIAKNAEVKEPETLAPDTKDGGELEAEAPGTDPFAANNTTPAPAEIEFEKPCVENGFRSDIPVKK